MLLQSWISSKTAKDLPSKIADHGFFATAPIKKGEVLAVKAGHIIDQATLEANRAIINDSEVEVVDGLYIAPLTAEEMPRSMVYFNHSCNPNAGIGGNIVLVAMRDIEAGEELTTDYAMHFTDPNYQMTCNCQEPTCRKTVTGNDWQLPELQAEYAGYFSWYIQQKIAAVQNEAKTDPSSVAA